MPFDARNLAALIASDTTTFWFYRTTDTRAAVLAPGYFDAVANQLQGGHIMLVQSADSLGLLPVRAGGGVGNGIVLDVLGGPIARAASAALLLGGAIGGAAIGRSVRADSPPNTIGEGEPFTFGASITGATTSVLFRLVNAAGTILQTVSGVPVSGGRASATLSGPPSGTGYRVRVIDTDDADARSTTAPFNSAPPQQLAAESGAGLTTEGDAVLLA